MDFVGGEVGNDWILTGKIKWIKLPGYGFIQGGCNDGGDSDLRQGWAFRLSSLQRFVRPFAICAFYYQFGNKNYYSFHNKYSKYPILFSNADPKAKVAGLDRHLKKSS